MTESVLLTLPALRRTPAAHEAAVRLAVDLEDQVQARLRGRLRNFQVLLTNDGLVLRGQVASYYVKQLVQHAVMSNSPAPIRANEIEVTREVSRLPR